MRRRQGITHKLVRVAGVIRLRESYGGRVDPGYKLRRHRQRDLQDTSGAKPFRGVRKNFGAAFPANSDYPDHCRVVRARSLLYSVKFWHTLRGHEFHQFTPMTDTNFTNLH